MKGFILSDRVSAEKLPPCVIFTDTETSEGEGGSLSLLLGYYEAWQVDSQGLPEYMSGCGFYETESEFYSVLAENAPCRVVAHNWQFDASVLRIGSRENMNAWKYDIDIEAGIYPIAGQGYAPFLICLNFEGKGKVELVCNTNFYKMSLSKIGASIGVRKLDMPEAELSDAMREYCKTDVEILRKAWFSIFAYTQQIANTTPGITAAMAANRVYRKAYYNPKRKVQGSQHIPYVNNAERAAYHGGRTDTFYKGRPDSERIYKYDVNSLYPSCMLGGIPVRYLQKGVNEHIENPPADTAVLADVTLNIPVESAYGFLGLEGVYSPEQGQLIFGVGIFRCWIWQPLLEICLEQGYIQQIHNVLLYETENLFDGYIGSLYAMRQEYKAEGNYAFDMLTKLFMNSLYGKFAQRKNSRWNPVDMESKEYEILAYRDSLDMQRFKEIWEGVESDYWQVGGSLYRNDGRTQELSRAAVCSIAGYITAKGRAVLWRAMAALLDRGATLYMCDTDSVITDTRMPDAMVSESKLGAWKLEETADGRECEFIAPKHYIITGKIKLKGVRNPTNDNEHPQIVFPNFMTDLMSTRKERRARLEAGPALRHIVKVPTGLNTKRREVGYNMPTYPFVMGAE